MELEDSEIRQGIRRNRTLCRDGNKLEGQKLEDIRYMRMCAHATDVLINIPGCTTWQYWVMYVHKHLGTQFMYEFIHLYLH